MKNLCLTLFSIAFLFSCAIKPSGIFSEEITKISPDYSNSKNWAALPTKEDMADKTPNDNIVDKQAEAAADVFFLHPTTYTFDKNNKDWNGDLNDSELNKKTDETTILHQASIFNGAGRVYAPRYRQVHLYAFYTEDEAEKKHAGKAYELAYQDLKAAFEYYLKNYNEDRPIIIAAHSQGAGHGIRLIKEFFDGTPLQKKLITAYLVGWPVENDAFEKIKVCETPEEIGCFCSWRSFKSGHYPTKRFYQEDNNIAVTNPLSWTTNSTLAPKELNEGAVLLKYEKIYPELADAQVENGVLWVHKPKFPGSFLYTKKNYHVADLNFFWMNVRKNAADRVDVYLMKHDYLLQEEVVEEK